MGSTVAGLGGLLGDVWGLYIPPATPGTSGPGKPPVDTNFLAPFINRQSVGLHVTHELRGPHHHPVPPLMAQQLKNPPANQETRETQVRSLGWEDPLEEEMATHSRILASKIPWTKEPGGLQSMGCKESDTREQLPLFNTSPPQPPPCWVLVDQWVVLGSTCAVLWS